MTEEPDPKRCERAGMAPLRWLTAPRLREARRLLEVSDIPVDDWRAKGTPL